MPVHQTAISDGILVDVCGRWTGTLFKCGVGLREEKGARALS